jgi:glycosyltransferase involved in cell wall biosynthesis
MRILIVTQYFWPENFRINDLVSELKNRGHKLTVLTGKPNYPSGKIFPEFLDQPSEYREYRGAEVIRVPMLSRSSGFFRLSLNYLSFLIGAILWGTWSLRKKSFDLVFVYGPSPIIVALPAILLARIKRIPIVFWVLDLWPESLSAVGAVRSKTILKLVGSLVGYIYKHCTLVLGQSQSFINQIAIYCKDKTKIRYYPSWAENLFDTKSLKAPEVPIKTNSFDIVFAGNIGDSQDMPAILDAAEILKYKNNVRWLIIGDGRKYKWLQLEVKRRKLQKEVLILGRYPIDRMPSFYAHADVLLVTLKKDPVFSLTIPAKLQSYLMAGIPVLGMLDGEGANLILNARAGIPSPAGDSRALASSVLEMMTKSPSERSKMGRKGCEYIKKEFDRGALISTLENFLNEAVQKYKEKTIIKR